MNSFNLPDTYLDIPSFNGKYKKEECSNSFSLVHFNCRSLPCNFDYLNMYLSSLDHNFKVIGLTETWLNSLSPLNLYPLSDYNLMCNTDSRNKVVVQEFIFITH